MDSRGGQFRNCQFLFKMHYGTTVHPSQQPGKILPKIIAKERLDKGTKFCYSYDSLNRVIKRTVQDSDDNVLAQEVFAYDAAGNMTSAPDSSFLYDTNNRLIRTIPTALAVVTAVYCWPAFSGALGTGVLAGATS